MWAIVPIKTFEMAKQRLANVLSASERKSLMLAMARDVLTALSSSNLLDHILIVSRAPEADALAQAFNTERFSETPSAGLADALEQATHHLVNNFNADGVFVVPADVPGVNAEELDTLISNHQAVTVLPDAKKVGTNGLICSPPLAIPYIFDGQSFRPHVEAAFKRDITPVIVPNSCFSLDVDVPSDLTMFFESAPHSQTGTFLSRAGIIDRLSEIGIHTMEPKQ